MSKRNSVFTLISSSLSPNDFLHLARLFDFSEGEIKDIETSVIGLPSRIMVMLSKYEVRETRIETNKLLKYLEFLKLQKLADEIREILKY